MSTKEKSLEEEDSEEEIFEENSDDLSIMESLDYRIIPPELIKISIVNLLGIFLVTTSIFFPWFSYNIGFWDRNNIFLDISLALLLFGALFSLISSFSLNLKKKHRTIGFIGIILIFISISVFLWLVLGNHFDNFDISTYNPAEIPPIGFYIVCSGTVILFVSELDFQIIYQQGADNHSLYNEDDNIEKHPHLRHKTLRISILSVIGVIIGVLSLFKPWFYQNRFVYEMGRLTNSSEIKIFFIDWFWIGSYFQYYLVISLSLFIIGLMFSLAFSMEMGFRSISTNMNWFGMIFMLMGIIVNSWSIYTFPKVSLSIGFSRTIYSIPYPDIGLLYSVVSLVFVFLGFSSLKTKNRILQRLTIRLKISSKIQTNHDKPIRFSIFSVIGTFLIYISIYLPWFYSKSESSHLFFFLTFRRIQDIDISSYVYIRYLMPFPLFQVSGFLTIIVSLFIPIIFLFEYPKLKKLTLVSLITPIIFIAVFIVFNSNLLSWDHPSVSGTRLYIPHIGSIVGFIGAGLMLLGYISLKNKSKRLSKSVFSIYRSRTYLNLL